MLDGVMLLWFVLTAAAVAFVAIDIRSIPESSVLKWGFVLVTAYTGVIGAFLYVLGCREPLPGTHDRYVASQWRQALGSTMHCVAGDGIGMLAGAILASVFGAKGFAEVVLEYALGLGFGWTVFQALFMRDMAGGSYSRSLASTFIPELLSMNLMMTGMVPTMMILRALVARPSDPTTLAFWFVMSMALLVGFVIAYPINWWLVRNHLKHGMLTVHATAAVPDAATPAREGHSMHAAIGQAPARRHMAMEHPERPRPPVFIMAVISSVALVGSLVVASTAASLEGGRRTATFAPVTIPLCVANKA